MTRRASNHPFGSAPDVGSLEKGGLIPGTAGVGGVERSRFVVAAAGHPMATSGQFLMAGPGYRPRPAGVMSPGWAPARPQSQHPGSNRGPAPYEGAAQPAVLCCVGHHDVDVAGAAPAASSVWARRSPDELHVAPAAGVAARRAGTPTRTEIRGVKARSVRHYLIPALLLRPPPWNRTRCLSRIRRAP